MGQDAYESLLTRGLYALADEAPSFPGLPTVAMDSPRRRGPWAPLTAAAAVAAIIAGAYATGLTQKASHQQQLPPAGSGQAAAEGSSSTPAPLPNLASKDEVRAVADPLAGLYDMAGFGKVSLDFSTREVHVWWKGTPPAEVSEASGVNADGVRLVVIQATYSDQELRAAAQMVADAAGALDVRINTIGQAQDLSGLVVYVNEMDLRHHDNQALSAQLSRLAKVPVSLAVGGEYHAQ